MPVCGSTSAAPGAAMSPSGDAPSHSSASSGESTLKSMCETSAPVSCLYASTASSSLPLPHSVASFPAKGSAKPSFSSHSSFRPPRQNPHALLNADAVRREDLSASHLSPPCVSPESDPSATDPTPLVPGATNIASISGPPPLPPGEMDETAIPGIGTVASVSPAAFSSFPPSDDETWPTSSRCRTSCARASSQLLLSMTTPLPPGLPFSLGAGGLE
mmetsp:Transcript_1846/g.8303  ORF Transcript_1846/g.8303 Transcript_1846/m.8303 type:complete len:217 (+) Transcript_1846:481-1131(+)